MKFAAASKDGARIAFDRVDQGPVLVLALGALNSRKSGASLARLLAPRFTVISYDRRGRGDSTDAAPAIPWVRTRARRRGGYSSSSSRSAVSNATALPGSEA